MTLSLRKLSNSRIAQTARTAGTYAVLGVFGLVATGCGPATSTTKSTPPQIRVWRFNQDYDVARDVIAQFQKDNPGVKVTYEKKDAEGYELASLKSMAAKQGPDVWSIPNNWIGDHADRLVVLPESFYFEQGQKSGQSPAQAVANFYPAGIAEQITRTDGKVFGLPTNADALQLYYNPDLMSTALQEFRQSLGNRATDDVYKPVQALLSKPPATWSDLLEQSKYITKRDGTTVTRGTIAMGTADNIPQANDLLELLILQNGAKIVSSDRQRALFHQSETTPSGSVVRPGEKALEFYTSFANPAKQNYSWNPSMPSALDAFASGKVAMVIAYSDFGQQLRVKYPRFKPERAAVPQINLTDAPVNFIRFNVEVVTQTADNVNAAFAFLKNYTGLSSVQNMASDAGVRSPYLIPLKAASGDFLSQEILTGQSVYKRNRTRFDTTIRQMIVDVSQNGVQTGPALDTAADQINAILADKVE